MAQVATRARVQAQVDQRTRPAPAISEFEVALSDYRGKWLVFFFYPLDFTFVCPTEILALSDRYEEFTASARTFSARRPTRCSATGRGSTRRATRTASRPEIPARRRLYQGRDAVDTASSTSRMERPSAACSSSIRTACSSTRTVTSDNVGRSVDETLRVLQALQTGGLCPAEWKPGKALLTV